MTHENRRANIALEIAEARRHRAAAERNAVAGDRETAANRLYFAALHAVKGVCLSRGLEAKTHRGLKHLLITHFVAPGDLPESIETAFAQLETERDLADYSTGYRVSSERYEERRAGCDALLSAAERYLQANGWLEDPS